MSLRLPVPQVTLLRPIKSAHFMPARQIAPLRFASSATKPAVKIDQTKRSNNPDEDPTPEHCEQGTTARALEGDTAAAQAHPAKQPDPQPSPARSTGVQPNGPESRAGEGRAGAVHSEKLGGRSMEHSVNRPAKQEGAAAGGRGGNAM